MSKHLRILKVSIDHLEPKVDLDLPRDYKLLSIQNQRETLVLWYTTRQDPDSPPDRKIRGPQWKRLRLLIGVTSNVAQLSFQKYDEVAGVTPKYLATVQFRNGDFVVHVFEDVE